MFILQMSGIIAVSVLILLWWVYSAGRKVDSEIYPRDEQKYFTISCATKDYSGLCVWNRKLTPGEILSLQEANEIVEVFTDPVELFIKYKDMTYITRHLIRRACEEGES